MRITKATVATLGNDGLLPCLSEVGNHHITSFYQRPDWHFDNQWLTRSACHLLLTARNARLCLELWFVAKLEQGIKLFCCKKYNITTTTAVSAIGSTFVYIYFMSKAHRAVATTTRYYCYFCCIYKHILLSIPKTPLRRQRCL